MNYHKPCLPALFWKLVDRNACWVIKATLRSTQGRWFSYMAAALPWSRPCCGKKSISVGLCYRYQRWDETSTSSGPRSRGRRGGLECVGHVHFVSHDLMSLFFFFFSYSDDRLVSILRHHSFLEELQEVALQGESLSAEDTSAHITGGGSGLWFISLGGQEGAERDGGEDAATQASEAVGDIPGELYLHSSTLMHPPGKDRFYPCGVWHK